MISFGENLRRLRNKACLTQANVALALQITHQSISKWENDIALPSIYYCLELTKVLNCTLNDLFQISIE